MYRSVRRLNQYRKKRHPLLIRPLLSLLLVKWMSLRQRLIMSLLLIQASLARHVAVAEEATETHTAVGVAAVGDPGVGGPDAVTSARKTESLRDPLAVEIVNKESESHAMAHRLNVKIVGTTMVERGKLKRKRYSLLVYIH